MNKKHLSVLGVGPIYVSVILITTCVLYVLNYSKILPSFEFPIPLVTLLLGVLLIIIGIVLWVNAVISSKITVKIKNNILVTNGIFAYVRNPIYSAFMFICSGVIIYSNNIILFVVPLLFWLFLTVLMINTEEKWLRDLYKDEYDDYCKKVNRCIPMFKKTI